MEQRVENLAVLLADVIMVLFILLEFGALLVVFV